jgi:4-methylaminobutanoate oxidase (formaldehyde-forming)
VACREGVAIFDESSFAKLEIAGPGAAALLERLCDNEVAREVGRVTYTQMLNSRGGIECDFTVARLADERFSIVTGTAFGNHDREWIRRHMPADGSVQVHDLTSAWACFGIWGPRARELLAPLTPQPLDNQEFPYMTLREITVGDVPVRALRVTYVGELGWELYCPSEYGMALWRALWEAGEPHGIVAAGYRAIDSMRIEKGYRVWGADITPDETPYEAGLDFAVKLDKPGGFIGRDALVEASERGPRKRLCCITLEDPRSVALGNEPVRVDGEIVGRATTGGYGYTVERSIAYAYLPSEHSAPGTAVELDIFGSWIAGEVETEPLFDPGGERVRGSA